MVGTSWVKEKKQTRPLGVQTVLRKESEMHQTNSSKGAWNLKLWMSWSRSQVKPLTACQNISISFLTLGITQLRDDWKCFVITTCGKLGCSTTCLQQWQRRAGNRKSFAKLLAPLFIYRSNLNWQIDEDLMQQVRRNWAKLMSHDCV